MSEETVIQAGDGKYEIRHLNGHGLRALRYGEPWRDLCGDALVLALVQRIEELEAALAQNAQGKGETPFGYIFRNVAPFRSVTPQWQFTHHCIDPHGCIEAMPVYVHAERARVPDGCIPIHRTLLEKLATDMDSIDMPKIAAAIRRWIANYLLAAAPPKSEDTHQPVPRRLEHWFFKYLVDDQRQKLFSLYDLPVNDIRTHVDQRRALRLVLAGKLGSET